VFELSAAFAVDCDRRPVVLPVVQVLTAQVDHGFNRKGVALLHEPLGLIFSLVGHVGQTVEEFAYSMADVLAHHRQPPLLGFGFDYIAQLPVHHPGFADFDGFLQSTLCAFNEFETGCIDVTGLAHHKCFI